MPRKSKTVITEAKKRGPVSIDDLVANPYAKEVESWKQQLRIQILQEQELAEEQRKLEERIEKMKDTRQEYEERIRRAESYMKLGAPMDMTKTGKKLISINIPTEMKEKLDIVKECYHDGLSGYIRYLIEQDFEKNYEKYLQLRENNRTVQAN